MYASAWFGVCLQKHLKALRKQFSEMSTALMHGVHIDTEALQKLYKQIEDTEWSLTLVNVELRRRFSPKITKSLFDGF